MISAGSSKWDLFARLNHITKDRDVDEGGKKESTRNIHGPKT